MLRPRYNPLTGKVEYEDSRPSISTNPPNDFSPVLQPPPEPIASIPGKDGLPGRDSEIALFRSRPQPDSPGYEGQLGFQPVTTSFFRKVQGKWKFLVNVSGNRGKDGNAVDGSSTNIKRTITSSFTIADDYTRIFRRPTLNYGVIMTIEPNGEAYVL